jgi:hypothetical protein
MQEKLDKKECLDVREIGESIGNGLFRLHRFVPDVDYCDAQREDWIWSIGRNLDTGEILASTTTIYYQNPRYECLWLR